MTQVAGPRSEIMEHTSSYWSAREMLPIDHNETHSRTHISVDRNKPNLVGPDGSPLARQQLLQKGHVRPAPGKHHRSGVRVELLLSHLGGVQIGTKKHADEHTAIASIAYTISRVQNDT